MLRKILVVVALGLILVAPSIAKINTNSIGWLGNADRTFQDGTITCYLGALGPGIPTYFCGWNTPDGFAMDHSWLASSSADMNKYYMKGGTTATYTYSGK